MKKNIICAFALCFLFFSCRKDQQPVPDSLATGIKENITRYVNANKDPKVVQLGKDLDELLKAMDFSQMHKETYKPNEDIWVVPVSANYALTGGKTSNNATLSFIVFANKKGEVRTGKLVRFIPQDNATTTMPANAFHDFYTFDVNLNGTYEFYASWRKISEAYDYKNGTLQSHGLAKPKTQTNTAGRTEVEYDCEVYVWEERHYDQYGNLLYITQDWLFEVCTLAEHPWIQTIVPPPSEPTGPIFDEDYDMRHALATIHWSLAGPRGSNWTLNFETGFRGIKDPTPSNCYFYFTAIGAATTITSSNPDLYWDGYETASIVNTTTVNEDVIGGVKLDFPYAYWPLGTTSVPYTKVFSFTQVFP